MDHQDVKNWHSDPLDRTKRIDADFRMTQNVRRFLTRQRGDFTLGPKDRAELEALKCETLGQVVDFIKRKKIS